MSVTIRRDGAQQMVGMLTDEQDGTITVRLHPSWTPQTVRLREPTALEYAEIRSMFRDVDGRIEDEFPPIPVPVELQRAVDAANAADKAEGDGGDVANVSVLLAEYQKDVSIRNRARNDYLRDPEKAPYAHALLEALQRLSTARLALEALPVEGFSPYVCAALLEVWETPLGGPVDAGAAEETVPAPAPVVEAPPDDPPENPTAATEPASLAPEQS